MPALYHRAIATAWSSARREWSEKSIGHRIRWISIIVASMRQHVDAIGDEQSSAARSSGDWPATGRGVATVAGRLLDRA
jgi:hypothetical protein